ncbi:MAG: hypothetical protein EXR69_02885 [Myxococcales bacterium]|nr:hypothetical protein [Myxococcales bacterium]
MFVRSLRPLGPLRPALALALVVGLVPLATACKPKVPALEDLERPNNETCLALERPASSASVVFTEAWPGLRFEAPLAMRQLPAEDAWWYVVEQGGAVERFDSSDPAGTLGTVLDIGDLLATPGGNEAGLLGMDFHPDFANNGHMYVSYTGTVDRELTSIIERFTSTDGGASFDRDSGKVILTIFQPDSNHNGGNILFGPDGYLYIGFGDGGGAGDPRGYGQDMDTLLAKILRVDVDRGDPYAIPADNVFADGGTSPGGGVAEAWATGLRNPWRFSFDSVTGEMWAGDVGQDKWEEVDLVRAGGNYGWSVIEGTHCYNADPCDEGPWIAPVVEYKHNSDNGVTIVGGYVYRGTAIPDLVGTYLYADTYSGRFWALTYDPLTGDAAPTVIAEETGYFPASFAQDHAGEVYFTEWNGGRLYRIDPDGSAPAPSGNVVPDRLSETGCVDPVDPRSPASGMISYEVNSPLWSDAAEKSRWFAVPDGTQITVNADGAWAFPVGSVVVKQFRNGDTAMETRLLVLHDDGAWAGYSYQWNETGTDATLLVGSSSQVYDTKDWAFPSRAECLRCHTNVAGGLLGLRTEQLNGPHTYDELGGGTYNQIDALSSMGFFAEGISAAETLTAWPVPSGDASATERGRSYVAANCAFCHLPDGTGGGAMDLRWDTPLTSMGICDVDPISGDLGVVGAKLLDPGSPDTSLLVLRMASVDAHRMPPLASLVVDDVGLAAVRDWITETESCAE